MISKATTAAPHSTQKIRRQSPSWIRPEPAKGASIGETEITSMTIAIIFVPSVPVAESRMTARGTTISTAPPMPCTARAATKAPIVGASAAMVLPTMKIARPAYKGRLRPDWSDHGP